MEERERERERESEREGEEAKSDYREMHEKESVKKERSDEGRQEDTW